MTSMISYMKAIHSLHASLDEGAPLIKENLLAKSNAELRLFAEQIRGNESLKFIFRSIMENLVASSTKNAVFFAETLHTLIDKSPIVIYLLGECYFANSDWLKVYQLFQNHGLLYHNDNYLVLAAKALLNNKQYVICESIINKQLESSGLVDTFTNPKLRSAKYLVLAKCQEVLEKKKSATTHYFESLKSDPTNVEALTLLMDNYLVTLPESRAGLTLEEQFLNNIQFTSENLWIKKFFLTHIKDNVLDENKNTLNLAGRESTRINAQQLNRELFKSAKKSENNHMDIESEEGSYRVGTSEGVFETLVKKDNIDILCIKAKNAFMKYDVQSAYRLSKRYSLVTQCL